MGCPTAATAATTKVATVAPITIIGGWLTVTTDGCLTTTPTGAADCTADDVTGTAAAADAGTGTAAATAVAAPVAAVVAAAAAAAVAVADDESPFIHDSIQKLFTPWCMYAYSQPP